MMVLHLFLALPPPGGGDDFSEESLSCMTWTIEHEQITVWGLGKSRVHDKEKLALSQVSPRQGKGARGWRLKQRQPFLPTRVWA
jgi:hypothetical protein